MAGTFNTCFAKKKYCSGIVTAGYETVAVRMPNNKIALKLIEGLGNPIAAPSANSFGKLSPTSAQHVVKQLGEKVDIVLDGGNCSVGVESTIVEITETKNYLLRPGGIAKEEIEEIIGKLELKKNTQNPNSPGQLKIHYAPDIPIYFYDKKLLPKFAGKKLGGLFFKESKKDKYFSSIKILSQSGNLREAASNIFSFLHEFENEKLDAIFVEKIEKKGLGYAIMDRLDKAVNKYQF